MTSVFFVEEASQEAQSAYEMLEAARPGLGEAFATTLAAAVERLAAHPEIGASSEFANATQRWKLARFPYSLIYLVGPSRVVIIAVAHERRRPGYWASRMR